MAVLAWLLIGLIAGAVARFLVPGKDPLGFLGTLLLGLIGSFVGGFLGNVLFDGDFELSTSGLLGSIIGAVVTLVIYRSTRSGATV